MIFEERFKSILDQLEGGQAIFLMGFDGISVVSVVKPGVVVDTELMGAEVSSVVNQLRQAAFTGAFGELIEFVFSSRKAKVLIRVMTENYFIAVVLGPDAYIGKARFLLRLAESDFEAALI